MINNYYHNKEIFTRWTCYNMIYLRKGKIVENKE